MHFALSPGKCLMHHRALYHDAMSTMGERLRQARTRKGYATATLAAKALGVAPATYTQHENGTRGFPAKRAREYARAFGVTTDWLLYGREAPSAPPANRHDRNRRTVPLVGYVGAGAQAHFYAQGDGNLGEVDAPADAGDTTVAAEIHGVSLGPLFDHWLVFWDEVRAPVTSDMYGQLCVVGLPDDRILVNQIKPASRPDLFHLLSNNEEPMFDQEIVWAAKVTNITPR